METQTTENAAPAAAVAAAPVGAQKSRFAASTAMLRSVPKWALITIPVVAIGLAGYGYKQHRNAEAGHDASIVAMSAPVAAHQGAYYGEPMANVPVAYGPAYGGPGAYYGNNGNGYGDGRGYGHGYSRGQGRGNGRMNASFSFGGNFDSDVSGAGNGYGNGAGNGYGNNYGRNGGWW
jgi:hypothetical protein